MAFLNWLSACAVTAVVSGNTGVSPFLSLFLVGVVEKIDPTLLNMEGTVEWVLSSWPSLVVLGLLTVLEFVGKCVPLIDTVIDSAMTFVVPVFSVLGSLSTFGLFEVANGSSSVEGGAGDEGQGRRALSIASGAVVVVQVAIVFVGVVLALSMHAVKMLIRLIGEGWLTNCLAVMETMWVCLSILLAIFIREVAIFIAAVICLGAGYNIKRRYVDAKEENGKQGTSDERLYSEMDEEQAKYSATERVVAVVVEK